MQLIFDHQEAKDIIKALKKDGKKFLAERIEKAFKFEIGKHTPSECPHKKESFFADYKPSWGDKNYKG